MIPTEHFEVPAGAGVVAGHLRARANGSPIPVVLLCGDPPGSAIEHDPLLDDLAGSLAEAGIATVRFDRRRDDPEAIRTADSLADDAASILDWILTRPELDAKRIGVFGYCLGAITSAALAARHEHVNRVCLLAPVTGDDVTIRVEKTNGLPTLVDPLEIPGAFLSSLSEMTPVEDLVRRGQPTLILRGAADRVVPAASVHPYVEAVELAEVAGHSELIARASHEFSAPSARAVCFARIEQFFAEMQAQPNA